MGKVGDPVGTEHAKTRIYHRKNKSYNKLCKFQTVRTIQVRKLDLAIDTKEKKMCHVMDSALMAEYRIGLKERVKGKRSVSMLPMGAGDNGYRPYGKLQNWNERKGKRKEIIFLPSYRTCR